MVEFPKIPKSALPATSPVFSPTPSVAKLDPISAETAGQTMAEAADIRRPSGQLVRDEESGAQKARPSAPNLSVPAEIRARADFLRKTAQHSVKVEGRGEAFLNFLKDGPSGEEAHLLVAEAQLMAGLAGAPRKKARRKRRWRQALRHALAKSIYLLDSVRQIFRKNR